MKRIALAAAAGLLLIGSAAAQQKTTVEPGNGPTESISKAVPTMKDNCPGQTGNVDTKAPGTEATEATGSAVPTMKPNSAADCPPGTKTQDNNAQ